ncbi:MAG: hypothetical protein MUF54_05255 [Polyangiaceae bacterium]|nr:hypothetical protein [Polyangiaceae bacterium]
MAQNGRSVFFPETPQLARPLAGQDEALEQLRLARENAERALIPIRDRIDREAQALVGHLDGTLVSSFALPNDAGPSWVSWTAPFFIAHA